MIAYFDCFSGISGDMILGGLIDLGLPLSELKASLSTLHLPKFKAETLVEDRLHLKGTRLLITLEKSEKKEKTFKEIRELIEKSNVDFFVKEKSIEIFHCLAKAEAQVHQKSVEKVHFHEIGDADSIIDIVGSVFGLHYLNIEEVISSPLPLGKGFIQCNHGLLPLPAPATLEIVKGIPVYGVERLGETVTPTGAAIISTLARTFGALPFLRIEKVGYGVGERDDKEIPNMLRIILGNKEKQFLLDNVVVIESNIDDMNPEVYEYLMEVLFKIGALDVSLIPMQMKKNRPGVLLKVIAKENDKSEIIRTIFKESTTLGIRVNRAERLMLSRKTDVLETPWGKVHIKIIEEPDGTIVASPEYEDCKSIARERNISLKHVLQQINKLITP